ncbi:uncharacterized protein LOC100372673 isoform X1 [Saccoglossus kowalevskii]
MDRLIVASSAFLVILYITCFVDVTIAYDDSESEEVVPPNYWSLQLAELTELVKLGEEVLAQKASAEMKAAKRGRGTSACGGFATCKQLEYGRKYATSKADLSHFGATSPGRKRRTTNSELDKQA